jgi:hypothetical protein
MGSSLKFYLLLIYMNLSVSWMDFSLKAIKCLIEKTLHRCWGTLKVHIKFYQIKFYLYQFYLLFLFKYKILLWLFWKMITFCIHSEFLCSKNSVNTVLFYECFVKFKCIQTLALLNSFQSQTEWKLIQLT